MAWDGNLGVVPPVKFHIAVKMSGGGGGSSLHDDHAKKSRLLI